MIISAFLRIWFSEKGYLVWSVDHNIGGDINQAWQAHNDNGLAYNATGNLAIKGDSHLKRYALLCPLRMAGQYENAESGLYYNYFRYYDPIACQYITPDPIGIEGGFSPHAYVTNPLTMIDPLGLKPPASTSSYQPSSGARSEEQRSERDLPLTPADRYNPSTQDVWYDPSVDRLRYSTGPKNVEFAAQADVISEGYNVTPKLNHLR